MANIDNSQDVIDSLDIIERIEELRRMEVGDNMSEDETSELATLETLSNECSGYSSDWEYGETLIRRSYFEQYMDEMVADCYEMPKDLPSFMTITLDYYALEQDYASVDYDGVEYLIRSV